MKTLLTDSELKKEIVRIVTNNLKSDVKVYLFGSRTSKTFKETSDYDICIDAGHRIPGEIMQDIREDIESLPVMQKIDLSDWYTLDFNFQSRIKETGLLLN